MTPLDPEEVEAAGAPARAELPPATQMGPVHLTVADLDRSLEYYLSAVGLVVSCFIHRRKEASVFDSG